MNAESTLNRVLLALGMKTTEVKLAQKKSEDGTTVFEAETFAVGDALFLVTEEGNIAAPQGEFTLEDGTKVYTDEMGIIVEVASAEAEVAEGEIAEVAAEDDAMKDQIEESMAKPKKVVTSKTEMEESYFSTQLKALEKRIATLEATNIQLSQENGDLKKALAEEPASHSKFNPEAESPRKVAFKIGARREATVADRVFNQLFS